MSQQYNQNVTKIKSRNLGRLI